MARNDIAPKIKVTKHSMAASVFRHQDGGKVNPMFAQKSVVIPRQANPTVSRPKR